MRAMHHSNTLWQTWLMKCDDISPPNYPLAITPSGGVDYFKGCWCALTVTTMSLAIWGNGLRTRLGPGPNQGGATVSLTTYINHDYFTLHYFIPSTKDSSTKEPGPWPLEL